MASDAWEMGELQSRKTVEVQSLSRETSKRGNETKVLNQLPANRA